MTNTPREARDKKTERKWRLATARAVKKRRRMLDMTQEEFAKRARICRTTVANIEVSRQSIALYQISILAKALFMKPQKLFQKIEEELYYV